MLAVGGVGGTALFLALLWPCPAYSTVLYCVRASTYLGSVEPGSPSVG